MGIQSWIIYTRCMQQSVHNKKLFHNFLNVQTPTKMDRIGKNVKTGWGFSSCKIWNDNIERHVIRPENFEKIRWTNGRDFKDISWKKEEFFFFFRIIVRSTASKTFKRKLFFFLDIAFSFMTSLTELGLNRLLSHMYLPFVHRKTTIRRWKLTT